MKLKKNISFFQIRRLAGKQAKAVKKYFVKTRLK
jgi:hypothetical protein